MKRRQLRLGFTGDEEPQQVVITPAADYLLGWGVGGYGYRHDGSGPLTLGNGLAVISAPWAIFEYADYLAMGEE